MNTTTNLILCELQPTNDPQVDSRSPFCIKAHRALKVAGLRYERRYAYRPDAHKAHNPTGQVPVLLVGDRAIADSTRILRYVAGERPSAFTLTDSRQEAEAWLWEELADTALNGFVVAARWADDRNWPLVKQSYFGAAPWFVRTLIVPRIRASVVNALICRDVLRAGSEQCWERFTQLLTQLERRAPLTGFWLGDRISVADLALFAQLRSFQTELTVWQKEQIAARPALVRYVERVDLATRGDAVQLAAVG